MVNAYDGRQTRILADIAELETECAHLAVLKQGKRLLLADRSGHVTKTIYTDGQVLERVQLHTAEIVELQHDPVNRMILSVSADRSLKLTQEDNLTHPIKVLTQVSQSQLTYAAASLTLGLVATASEAERVYVWKVQSLDLVGVLGMKLDLCAMKFAVGKSLLLTADFAGKVYGWNACDYDSLTNPVLILDTPGDYVSCMETEIMHPSAAFLTSQQEAKFRLYIGMELGFIQVWDLTSVTNRLPESDPPSISSLRKPCTASAQRFESLLRLGSTRTATLPTSLPAYARTSQWQVCAGVVVDLLVAAVPEPLLISLSHEGELAIWDHQGENLAKLNLKVSTPLFWNLRINTFEYRAQLYAEGESLLEQLSLDSPSRTDDDSEVEVISGLVDLASKPFQRPQVEQLPKTKVTSLRQMEAKKLVLQSMGETVKEVHSPPPRQITSLSQSKGSAPVTRQAIRVLANRLDRQVSQSPPRPEPRPAKQVIDYVETLDNTSDAILSEYLSAKHANFHANRSFSSDKFHTRKGNRLLFMQELAYSRNRSKNSNSSALYISADQVPTPDIRIRRRLEPQISQSSVTKSTKTPVRLRASHTSSPVKIQQQSAQDLLSRFQTTKTFTRAARVLMKFFS